MDLHVTGGWLVRRFCAAHSSPRPPIGREAVDSGSWPLEHGVRVMDRTSAAAECGSINSNETACASAMVARTTGQHRPPPKVVAALRTVGESQASASEKALLRAMLQWWNPQTGELWPSVGTLADSTGFSQRGVQKILRRLQEMGVVAVVQASRGGRGARGQGLTNRYLLKLHQLPMRSGAPASAAPLLDARAQRTEAVNPEPRALQPRTVVRINPERRSDEPTIGKTPIEPSMQPRRELQLPAGGCLDGSERSLRATLVRCGVRGANLETLATSTGLTSQAVEAELRDIQRDGSARNPAAVLVARLSQRTGTTLKSRPPLEQSTLSVVAKLEQMRRQLRGQASGDARAVVS